MAPKNTKPAGSTRKKTTPKALPKSRQTQKGSRPKKGATNTASGHPIAGQLGHRSEIPTPLPQNVQLLAGLFPRAVFARDGQDWIQDGDGSLGGLSHYGDSDSQPSLFTTVGPFAEVPYSRRESTLSAAADHFIAEYEPCRERMIPLLSTAGIPRLPDLESLWSSNGMGDFGNGIYRGTSYLGFPPDGGPNIPPHPLEQPPPMPTPFRSHMALSDYSQQSAGLLPSGGPGGVYTYPLALSPPPLAYTFDSPDPIVYSLRSAGLLPSHGPDVDNRHSLEQPPPRLRIEDYQAHPGPSRQTDSIQRFNPLEIILPPGAAMPLRPGESYYGETVIKNKSRMLRAPKKTNKSLQPALPAPGHSHGSSSHNPLSEPSSAANPTSISPVPNDLDKVTYNKLQRLFVVKLLLNKPITTMLHTDIYINETLQEVLDEPAGTTPRLSTSLQKIRSYASVMRNKLKQEAKRYVRASSFTEDYPIPPTTPSESAPNLSADERQWRALSGTSGADFVHVYDNGHVSWFALPVLREFVYDSLFTTCVIVPEEYASHLGSKASKGIIGLYTILLAYTLRVHLKIMGTSSKFVADTYIGEFDRLYQKMIEIEEGKEGDSARDEFEILKLNFFCKQS